ncbi:MAG: serine/threonine-protein kinase [Nostoc sp.]|uniref:serine/threonine-protein kinase n=1 Tax=Nostoc sp. TaxID=1180 RepID=UPI002FF72322
MNGRRINKRYEIIRELGKGGFGDTYLAHDQWGDSDNQCVVKQLKPDNINPLTLLLFKNEAEFLYKLGIHNQIPKLLAHFEEDNKFYLVQEFIDGHDLTKDIKIGERWGETEVIKLLEDILEILEFVHKKNVIHRDIKPANIMRRNQDGKIMLIDFGGVKQVRIQVSSTVLTPVISTPGYTPDEQFKNNAQFCSDIYAVGIVAIQALTGLQPLELSRDTKTGRLLWHSEAQASNRLADVLDKMVQFHYSERYQSAAEVLDAVKSLSTTALYWFHRGDKLVELKDYEKGIAVYDKAIQINPNYYQAWYHRGIALRQLKKFEEAIASFNQTTKINPNFYEAWYSCGLVLGEWEKYEEAIASFDQTTKIKVNYYHAWYKRGLILEKLGRYKEALACFDETIQIQSNYLSPYISRGKILNKLGKYEEEIESYYQAIEIQQNYLEAWIRHGFALNNLGQYLDALASFEQAIQIQTNNNEAWCGYGLVLNNLKRYEEAFASFNKALAIKADYQLAIENRKLVEKKLHTPRFLRWLGL